MTDILPTERELQALKVLWKEGQATVQTICQAINDAGDQLAYTTVLSLMQVMEQKGLVGHRREGKAYTYFPKIAREKTFRALASGFLEKVFDGALDEYMVHVLESHGASVEELDELEKMVAEAKRRARKKKTRPARITCWFVTTFVFCVAAEADAQIVQRPTYRTFFTTGSVVVPDHGRASLAGVNRRSSGRVSRGVPFAGPLFRNRAIRFSSGASNVSVRATIIDLRAMDKAILAEADRRRGTTRRPSTSQPRIRNSDPKPNTARRRLPARAPDTLYLGVK